MNAMKSLAHSTAEVGASVGSILRVAAWTLCFLAVLGYAVSKRQDGWVSSADTESFKEMVAFGDPRGFRAPLDPKSDTELRIAWLGSSSLRTHDSAPGGQQDIMKMTQEALIRRGELQPPRTQPVILSYFARGQRVYGLYLELLDALERDVDMVIVTIGPIYIYDTEALSRHRWWYPAAVSRLPAQPSAWLEFALLSQPSDWAQGLLSIVSPLVRNQADLHQVIQWIPSLVAMQDPPEEADSTESLLEFWMKSRSRVYGSRLVRRQQAMLEHGFDARPGSMNDRILDRMLELLNAADVPALVYVAPVSGSLREHPRYGSYVGMIETRMREKKRRFERPGMRIVAENPGRGLEGLEFHDYVHLIRTGDLIPRLVMNIEALSSGRELGGDEL